GFTHFARLEATRVVHARKLLLIRVPLAYRVLGAAHDFEIVRGFPIALFHHIAKPPLLLQRRLFLSGRFSLSA
ncbi:MAG: hypothetical protein J7M27_12705, partial [Candidatus Latescibacteria bacterium]|nr:hypothetical protein [Candidatus Latescibacterota bacterium]